MTDETENKFKEIVGDLAKRPGPLPMVSILDITNVLTGVAEVQMHLSQYMAAKLLGEPLDLPPRIETILPELTLLSAELCEVMITEVFCKNIFSDDDQNGEEGEVV